MEVFLYSKRDHYNNGRGGQDKQFEGRVFHFPDQLKSGNASIVIKKTKVEDSGIYTCHFPSFLTTQHIHLTVGECFHIMVKHAYLKKRLVQVS